MLCTRQELKWLRCSQQLIKKIRLGHGGECDTDREDRWRWKECGRESEKKKTEMTQRWKALATTTARGGESLDVGGGCGGKIFAERRSNRRESEGGRGWLAKLSVGKIL